MNMINVMSMQGKAMVFDLTKVLDEFTPVFPGDPKFSTEELCNINDDSNFTMQHLHFCNHAGTHIDFPAHVIKNGKTSNDYTIQDLIGECIILDYKKVFQNDQIIEKYLNENIKGKFIFFKNISYMHNQVADYLIQQRVKLVGVDSMSVDSIDNHHLTLHKMFLQENILIVENLFLENIPCQHGFVVIAPLNIANIDGAPVRVVMWSNQNAY